jgi:predicted ester cyclase
VARGRHSGDFFGIPATGKQIEVMGILIHHMKDGKIIEVWEVLDMMGLLEDLGIVLPIG